MLLQIAYDDLYYNRVNSQPVADLEVGFGERNRKEWTRIRRDGATITIKDLRDRTTGRFGVLDINPLFSSQPLPVK